MKKKFEIKGMMCAACQANVTRAISKVPGVENCNVSLLTNSAIVSYDESKTNDEEIINSVKRSGYDASIFINQSIKAIQEKKNKELKKQRNILLISLALLILLMVDSMLFMMVLKLPRMDQKGYGVWTLIEVAIQIFLLIPIIILNFHYFTSGYKSLFKLHPNMNSLIALGSTISTLYGLYAFGMIIYGCALGGDIGQSGHHIVMDWSMNLYLESGAMILVFVSIGKYFEKKATNKTTDSIASLLALTPETAYIRKGEEYVEVATETINIGDIVRILPGEIAPVDGKIISGYGNLDEANITGESMPIYKKEGDHVIASTTNKNGSFEFEVTEVGKDTTISKIISLVEEASDSKAPMARIADKIASIFVPVVIGLSLLTFAIWMLILEFGHIASLDNQNHISVAIRFAITVLVVSCPCALGLATPVAIMVGTGKGAENGILIKSAEAFEKIEKVSCILFDKTGTLTKGRPTINRIISFGIDEKEALRIAASLEAKSEHPLSMAFLEKAKELDVDFQESEEFSYIPGKGLRNGRFMIGNETLLKENGVDLSSLEKQIKEYTESGETLVFLADKQIRAIFLISDEIKENSFKAIEEIHALGKKVILVSGDSKEAAESVGKRLGIDKIYSHVLPDEKEKVVQELQKEGKLVAFVGDGVNDAPALTRADVGIAIGAGSDVAIDSADIILARNDPMDVASSVKLAKKVTANIKENLAWAFLYNLILIPIAGGALYGLNHLVMEPMFGSIAMSISSVTVVLNALRIKRFGIEKEKENGKENKD